MKYDTIKEATATWIETFNSIPMSVVEKVNEYDVEHTGVDSIVEITPPAIGDKVYIHTDEHAGEEGEIVGTKYDGKDDLYEIKFDSEPDNPNIISADCFDVINQDPFPMWGTMFVPPAIDQEWILGTYCASHLQEVADCGFRIYQSDDFGVLLGIDAAGFDFYEAFWCPLYKARGLCWHKEDEENGETKGSNRD